MCNVIKSKQAITEGRTALGIELGSTRIKAVLIDDTFQPLASGSHEWENLLEDGVWTYRLDDVWSGLQASFRNLADEVHSRYGTALETTGAIGISAMMHGYLAFDRDGKLLVPFRTWRNTMTGQASALLSEKFSFNIPLRWSIAHLYQAILNKESHVGDIAFLTTLAGYVHWKLSGQKVIGPDDGSGMFPLDCASLDYDAAMVRQFDELAGSRGFNKSVRDILPAVINSGRSAGVLTGEGAQLLDPAGRLKAGIPLCPPEGDAGTGMIATNSVAPRTGNVSAGTSVFAMIVLEKQLSRVYPEIDIVATPSGRPVAMVHCNNCTGDIDAWVRLFAEVGATLGTPAEKAVLYDALYNKALEADADCGGLMAYNYFSGEPITGLEQGRPLFARLPDSNFSLANFMRTLVFSAVGTLKIGMDIITEQEKVQMENLYGHGGFFKSGVGQRRLAGALNVPVSVMESAGEGGAWGIALLAAYMLWGKDKSLEQFLAEKVFAGNNGVCVQPSAGDTASFNDFMKRYRTGLLVEKAAAENINR
jgi:sugar (pentulose or hexulose) kinase